ncbi:MAG: preprotein translocase subunit SecA [Planctomycetales bacterium]|nr:preprotein translocase subunit SecA [Planctomycetales bacterium]
MNTKVTPESHDLTKQAAPQSDALPPPSAGGEAPASVIRESPTMAERPDTQRRVKPRASLLSLFKGRAKWHLDRWTSLLPTIEQFEGDYANFTDAQLRKESLSLRYRAKAGETLASLMPQAFALVRTAAQRTLKMRHFDVQILGGAALFHTSIAEMDTGEGKTLTASLPLYLHALRGKGSHLATVNDYLAARDAELMRPLYEMLGMSVGVVQTDMSRPQRRTAYAADITYGTAKEFGFDFLRDRLVIRRIKQERLDFLDTLGTAKGEGGERPVQRDAYFALVDEADSILIDEARTPLIISAIGDQHEESIRATYQWAADHAPRFDEDDDYDYDHEKKKVELTARGRQKVRSLHQPKEMDGVGLIDAYEYIERGIKVQRDFLRDHHYVVSDKEEIVIVDEFTGRLAEGRKWRDGIHQAIEAKEGIEITVDTGQAARITVQDLFLRYQHLAGMTGTAMTSAREFRKIYKTLVVRIPTNRPAQRTHLPDLVFKTEDEKWREIVREIVDLHRQNRPVLIGTKTIEKSELLSRMLDAEGIPHQVLNARHIAREAEIVAEAGQPGRVTVATNMAGRGTDIKLGRGVDALGGLHVIITEIHDSARIDRQLVGRCGRQGDPGTVRRFLSLDDDILTTGYGPDKAKKMRSRLQRDGANVEKLAPTFRTAQHKVERRHLRDRMILLHHEKQRKKMQQELGQDPYLDTPH